jgi:hypothetical protein
MFAFFSVNLGFNLSKTESYSKAVLRDGILIERKVFALISLNNFGVRSLSSASFGMNLVIYCWYSRGSKYRNLTISALFSNS